MRAIFAGSFDPFTLGHFSVVNQAIAAGFDEIIVAVADDTGKQTAPLKTRIDIVRASLEGVKCVKVEGFCGLTTDFAAKNDCKAILRGLRDGGDFEYEKNLRQEYQRLGDVELVYVISDLPQVSSSRVRGAAKSGQGVGELVVASAVKLVKEIYG